MHDPGGFAHNSTYAKRLIHDSIVWTATGATTPAVGQTIADIITSTTLVPDDPALVATSDGVPVNFTGSAAADMRNAAISWLTNGTGLRPYICGVAGQKKAPLFQRGFFLCEWYEDSVTMGAR